MSPSLLQITEWWTADTTLFTADSLYFASDGANLSNGGAVTIAEAVPGLSFNKPSTTVSAIIRLF